MPCVQRELRMEQSDETGDELRREKASGGSQREPSGYVNPASDERGEGNPFPRGDDGDPMVSAML